MSEREKARKMIAAVRAAIVWKPRKGGKHLAQRIRRGHLLSEATLAEYETIIRQVVVDDRSQVFCFHFGDDVYPAVVGTIDGKEWIVIASAAGIMETAFVVDVPGYLESPMYTRLGTVAEVMG